MEPKTALIVGAAAAALAGGPGLAAPAVPVAATYADLLEPIPNAVERLRQVEAEEAASPPPQFIRAQYADHHHHHHHHDAGWYRRNGYSWDGLRWILRPAHHHHHHHSASWYRHNGYYWSGGAWVRRRAHHHHHHHSNY